MNKNDFQSQHVVVRGLQNICDQNSNNRRA